MQHFKSLKNYLSNTPILSSNSNDKTSSSSTVSATKSNQASNNNNDNESKKLVQNLNENATPKLERGDSNSNKAFNNLIRFSRSFTLKQKKTSSYRSKFIRTKKIELEENIENLDEFQLNFTKKQLLNNNDLKNNILFEWLENELNDLILHFKQESNYSSINENEKNFLDTTEETSQTYFKLASYARESLRKCLILYKQVEKNAHHYDYDENIKSNGYRSMLKGFDSCCRRMLKVVQNLNERKSGFLFQFKLSNSNLPALSMNSTMKEFQTWVKLMERIESFLEIAVEMQNQTLSDVNNINEFSYASNLIETNHNADAQSLNVPKFHDGPSLYLHSNRLVSTPIEINLIKLGALNLDVYFGRACGFQFCDSLVTPLTGIAVIFVYFILKKEKYLFIFEKVALASYNDGYEAFSNKENIVNNFANILNRNSIDSSNITDKDLSRFSITDNTNSSASSPTSNKTMFTLPLQNNSLSNTLGQAAKSLFSSTKYLMDPELRGKKVFIHK